MILLGLLLSCSTPAPEPEPKPVVARVCPTQPVAQSDDPYVLLWGGDTLLGAAARGDLVVQGFDWPFEHIQPLLADADVRIFNAEAPLTKRRKKHVADQTYHYNVNPTAAKALAGAGFTLAGLANNHAMDRGPIGLKDTIDHLGAAGIKTFGAGPSSGVALRPAIIDTPHGKVGIVGFADRYVEPMMAGRMHGGVVGLTENRAGKTAARAREAGVDHLVAFVHWGKNYTAILDSQREKAKWLVDAGYDLVIGHGPHVQQTLTVSCGAPVAFSIGNLVFGTEGRFTDEFPGYGIVLRTELGAAGFQAVEASCIRTDNRKIAYQPLPCEGEEAAAILGAFLPGAQITGNVARLNL